MEQLNKKNMNLSKFTLSCGRFFRKYLETVALPTKITKENPKPTITPIPTYIDHSVCTTPIKTKPRPHNNPPSHKVIRGPYDRYKTLPFIRMTKLSNKLGVWNLLAFNFT